MSDNGSRILTVSAGGTVQLWNEQGEQIQKIEWADQAGGASGYPDAQTLILGSYGIAATHNNQIVVLNLTDGSVLAKKNTDAMFINRLIPFGKDRVFVGFSLWDWHGHRAAELTCLMAICMLFPILMIWTVQGQITGSAAQSRHSRSIAHFNYPPKCRSIRLACLLMLIFARGERFRTAPCTCWTCSTANGSISMLEKYSKGRTV